jgi:uncharacterized protein (TIGR02246 family)
MCFLAVVCSLADGWLCAQDTVPSAADEAAIRKTVEAYAEHFNNADARALANLWSPDAVYTNRLTGESVKGRVAIREQFGALFEKSKGLKIDLKTESIQFLSPNVAVEHGLAKLLAPNAEPEEISYSAIYVKRDDQWLLDRVMDEESQVIPTNYEHLKALEWMVGRWTTNAPNARVQLDCQWTKNRNFLTRAFAVAIGDLDFSGMQIIGWDPAAKSIRSWTFDSNGTFAEATWTRKGDQWCLHNQGVLASGQKASMVNVMKIVDEHSFTWRTIERTAGGDLLPNIDEVLVVRQ